MEESIRKTLREKVDPILSAHFGGASMTGFEEGVVRVKLTGTCGTCPSAQYTVEDVVKSILMEEVDGVKDVVLDTSVDEELLEMARKLMKHNRES